MGVDCPEGSAELMVALPSPNDPDPLIGRAADLASIEAALLRGRLVTVTGLGGTGKTRVAREIAANHTLSGGTTYFVDLAPVLAALGVTGAVASAMGVGEEAGRDLESSISSELLKRPALLVLDNFEHVLEARNLVTALLEEAPDTRILATSRVRLGTPTEEDIRLGSLAIPRAAGDIESASASVLFLRRARDRGRLRTVDPEDALAIVDICRRLDGLPLAVELAAAWTGILGPRAILRRLVDQRLDLSDSSRARQSSLAHVVKATLELVGEQDRRDFAAIGVFTGGFDEAAARSVAEDAVVLGALRNLEAVSLVRASPDAGGEPRFELLETVRAVAGELLQSSGDLAVALRRHVAYYADRAEAAANALRARAFNDPVASAALADPNMATAFERAVELSDGDAAMRLAASLGSYGIQSGILREGASRLRRALAMEGVSLASRADGLNALVSLRNELGEHDGQVELARKALETARAAASPVRIVRTMITLALCSTPEAVDLLREAASLAEEIGFEWGAAVAWTNLGNSLSDAGHHEEAIEALELARAAHSRLENHTGVAMALANRAEIKLNLGRIEAAKADIEEALSLFGAHGGPTGMAIWALAVRATAESLGGRQAAAMATLAQAAAQLAGSESGRTMDDWLDAASIVLSFEHPVTAARCLGAVDRIIEEMDVPRTGTFLRPAAAGRIELAIGRRRLDTERRAGRAVDGRTLFAQTAALVARHAHRDPGTIEVPFGRLTAREREILAQLALGRTDREIADELGISAKTASVHVANLKGKLGVGTRTEAALFAREQLA